MLLPLLLLQMATGLRVLEEIVLLEENTVEEKRQEREEVVVVREGEAAVLHCSSQDPWFFCAWSWGGGEERACLLQEGGRGEVRRVCGGRQGVRIDGSGGSCSLAIERVGREQEGSYLCMLSQGEELRTVRSSARLEVATRAELTAWVGDRQVEGGVLEMVEGELVSVKCRAGRAHPAPKVSWRSAWQEEGGATLQVSARAALTGSSISCLAEQGELFSSSLTLLLVVHPPPQHSLSLLAPSPASTVALLTILLSCLLLVLVLLLLLKLQKRRRGERLWSLSSSPCPSPTWPGDSGLTTSTPGGKTTHLVLDGNFVSFSPLDMYGGGDSLLEAGDALFVSQQRQAESHDVCGRCTETSSSIDFRVAGSSPSHHTSSSLLVSSSSSLPSPEELTLSCCDAPTAESPCAPDSSDQASRPAS